jgi:acyl carrier protein
VRTVKDIVDLIATSAIEVDVSKLRDNVDLYALGFDSLDIANLELRIQQEFGVDINSQQQSPRLRTINDYVNFLNENSANTISDND